ncbi:MAG TPA: hypothetical protein VIG33_06895, partial [Pseudobdellovibrionaceae bacterium]
MNKFILKTVLMTSLLGMGIIGCTSKSSDTPSAGIASITVTGAIASATSMSVDANVGKMALTLGNLEIYVIYTSGTTVGITQASVGTDGAWSFSVPSGAQINAIVRDKTSLELVGPIVFVDDSNTDLDGNAKTSTVTSLKSGASMGTITLSSEGKFEVPVAQIAAAQDTVVAAPTSKIDFTGAWTIGKYDGTLPDSTYKTAVAVGDAGCPTEQNCQGTPVGQQVYMLKLSGKKFTYPSTGLCATYKASHTGSCNPDTDGTTDATTTIDAASIWGGAAAIAGCGYKLGFTRDDVAAGGGMNLAAADLPTVNTTQLTFGGVTWSSFPTGWNQVVGGVTYPWANASATTNYPMMNCTQVDKTVSSTTYKINVCKGKLQSDHTTVKYQANYGGGCLNADGKPVVIKDWSALGTPASCNGPTNFAVTG